MEQTPPTPAPRAETGADELAREADRRGPGRIGELIAFLKHTRKWWLTPVIAALLLFGLIVIFSTTAAAPFIYALF